MYKTDNGYLVCEQTKEGFLTDFKLEGRTVVNEIQAWTTKDFINSNIPNNFTLSKNNTLMIKNFTTGVESYIRYNGINFMNYRDRTFTFICDISANVDTNTSIALIGEDGKLKYTELNKGKGNRHVCVKFKVSDLTISENTDIYLRFDHDTVNGGDVLFKNCMLLEGDNTQNPPNYFEGIKSVGQDVDKLVVSSVNGNLFDGEYIVDTKAEANGTLTSSKGSIIGKNFIKVTPNLNLSLKDYVHNRTSLILEYDINKNFTSRTGMTNNTCSLKSNTCYIKIYLFDASLALNCENLKIMLNLGTIPVSYKLFETDKKEILYYDTVDSTWKKPVFRGLWNNGVMTVGDVAEKKSDEKYSYRKRIGEVVLNGSEVGWAIQTINDTTVNRYNLSMSFPNTNNVICDKLLYSASHTLGQEHISQNTEGALVIYLSKTKATDLATFKTWLSTNNVTVVYQLAEEQIYECNTVVLDAFDNETILSIESGSVSPSVEFNAIDGLVDVVNVVDNLASELKSVKSSMSKVINDKGVKTSDNNTFIDLINKIKIIEQNAFFS